MPRTSANGIRSMRSDSFFSVGGLVPPLPDLCDQRLEKMLPTRPTTMPMPNTIGPRYALVRDV